jgi:hypothetical protein
MSQQTLENLTLSGSRAGKHSISRTPNFMAPLPRSGRYMLEMLEELHRFLLDGMR